jgi:arylsulfatase
VPGFHKVREGRNDDEITAGALDFIDRAHQADKPFFVWWNSTRMRIWTHLKKESKGKTGLGVYPDGMVEHDRHVGRLLQKLDDLGIADNTIVMYSTDNGAETFTWPDGGTTPFRSEKNTNWEGSYRVPCVVRWPGVIKPGAEINGIVSQEDWVPTFVAAAGEPEIQDKLRKGYQAGQTTFKVHLDGYDQRALLSGTGPGRRKEFFYWTDDGQLAALRYEQWKLVFMEQKAHGLKVWQNPLTPLRAPTLFSLRADPFELADHDSGSYDRWYIDHMVVFVPAQAFVAEHLATYREFPPRQKPRVSPLIRFWASCRRRRARTSNRAAAAGTHAVPASLEERGKQDVSFHHPAAERRAAVATPGLPAEEGPG